MLPSSVKILSPDITHKSDIGGVRLDLKSAEEVEKVTRQMLADIQALSPDAHIQGVTVQPRIRRKDAYELILGITSDPTFGPVILFGAGGTAVEAIGDTAMALTPLDLKLASELIESTRIYRLLRGFRNKPAVDLKGLALCLVKLSSLAVQHPAIRELDINPLLIDEKGMLALDARIEVEDPANGPAHSLRDPSLSGPVGERRDRLLEWGGGVHPADPPRRRAVLHAVHGADGPGGYPAAHVHARSGIFAQFLARMTQIDYAREMAFVALRPDGKGEPEMLGVVPASLPIRTMKRANMRCWSRSDLKGYGLGWVLMRHLIRYAKAEGLKTLHGTCSPKMRPC